jgi:hypothetical protein
MFSGASGDNRRDFIASYQFQHWPQGGLPMRKLSSANSPPVAVEQRQMTLERRETTTYLCGVGPIYKSTQYFSSEE